MKTDPAPDYATPGAPLIAVDIETIGEGDALFFRDGVVVSGKWKKDSWSSRMHFTAVDGKPYELQRGNVWVEVIPDDKEGAVEFSAS